MPSRPFIGSFVATATGTKVFDLQNSPVKRFSIQVKGLGASATSWTINAEGSIDGANWTVLIAHATADLDGVTKFDSADKPVLFVRINVSALVLGPAASIKTDVIGVE